MKTTKYSKLKILLFILVVYSAISALKLECENFTSNGGRLQSYHKEYEGGGSGKWRIWGEKEKFPGILFTCGIPVYFTSIGAIFLGIIGMITKDKKGKIFCLICSAVSLLILWRYIYLGVFSAAFEMG
ncbi:MAG: hypothetical protein IAF38_20565 [Bacteroidia bacterium]|nr:hypothetical protein [Bacteroidia bacterium]